MNFWKKSQIFILANVNFNNNSIDMIDVKEFF